MYFFTLNVHITNGVITRNVIVSAGSQVMSWDITCDGGLFNILKGGKAQEGHPVYAVIYINALRGWGEGGHFKLRQTWLTL